MYYIIYRGTHPPFEMTSFMDVPKGAEIFYLVVVDGEAIISFSFYVKAGTTGYFYLALLYTNSSEILIWAVIIVLPKVHDLFIWTCCKVTWIWDRLQKET